MSGRPTKTPFRVFGSPYTLSLHQHVTYLRLKQVPFRVYCTSFTTTFVYSLYYHARSVFCTLTPSGSSPLQVWQLAEAVELDEDVEAIARSAKGEVSYAGKGSCGGGGVSRPDGAMTTAPRTQRLLVRKETHPQLHLASWCVVVYACWWLAKTGAMFRYIRGDALDVLEGYVRYFFPIPGIGFARSMAPRFREVVRRLISATGASDMTAPFMEDHFQRFCTALEAHLHEHPSERFLLGTPHPTLADVTLSAAFSGFFLMDDPPSSMLADQFPCVTEYVERVTGWRGATFVGTTKDAAFTDEGASTGGAKAGPGTITNDLAASAANRNTDYPDTVPESLAPCFELIAEVLPFLMSQCASFNAFMAGDGIRTLRREPLEGEWKGCTGYLMPQLVNIRSLMIVDDNVSSVQARSQDLEIAFLAAREVLDDKLHDFGRREDDSNGTTPHDVNAHRVNSPEADTSATIALEVSKSMSKSADRDADDAQHLLQLAQEDTVANESATRIEGTELKREVGAAVEAAQFRQPLNLSTMRAEEADFYCAYTAAARYKVAGTAASLSDVVPPARQTMSAGSTAVTVRGSVKERLQTLYAMLAKMSCPQYTLTSLYHGRRIYVAAIPEYEVAKVRKARQEARKRSTVA
ncbi:Glutathione S-transferase, C-terminal domain containing protein, putative [Leishmania lindenbergi]|uniref:Glutathione S-transferase, C-terminal domain containing protein n=1 Tax=Leishmania lindenbergi TaxID=651832 RepID=A0AAW2ZTU5_9TRYP